MSSATASTATYARPKISEGRWLYQNGATSEVFRLLDIDTTISSKFRHLNDLTIGGVITVWSARS